MDVLLKYQKDWIENDADYSIYTKSRRIGITFAESIWSVRRRLTHKIDHLFISLKSETALEFVRYCKIWAEVFNLVLREDVIDLKGSTTSCLVFPNGSRILAQTSNPEGVRGMGGDCTIDEFAFHEQSEAMYRAAKSVRDWGGKLRIISTENGPMTTFHELLKKAPGNGFSVFKTTLIDAVEQGLALKVPGAHLKLLPDVKACNEMFIEDKRRTSLSGEDFAQEYMCETISQTTVVSPEEYDRCVLGLPILEELEANHNSLLIGIEDGRSKNLSVLWVLEEGVDAKAAEHLRLNYRTLLYKELDGMPFGAQYELFDRFIGHKAVYKCCIDAGGIGMQLAEDLAAKYGDRVEAVHLNNTSKARLVERTKKFIAQRRVTLPKDEKTKGDITAMRRVPMKSGGYSYDGTAGNSHCDRFIALGLALEAAERVNRLEVLGAGSEKDQ